MKKRDVSGFTLVEIMIVVAIVAILAAIGFPSYFEYLVRASRSAAQGELMELTNLQEKIYLNSNAYSTNLAAAYTGLSTGGLGKTTSKTVDSKYDLTLQGATAQSYEIRAVPVAGTPQAPDGTFSIFSNGTRTCAAPIPKWCKGGVW